METNYKRGARREQERVMYAKRAGLLAFRSAGSHSPIDVFILSKEMRVIKLIQFKPTSMPHIAKERLKAELQAAYDGFYKVVCSVE